MVEVSVSVITYNHEKYIAKCLDSILSQKTNFQFEILIHDDASTDGTVDIIKEYEKKYPDIVKPIYEKENQYSKHVKRISYLYNYKRAEGKYIAQCEGDDFWCDDRKLQIQYDYMEQHPNISMHMHTSKIVDIDGNDVGGYLGKAGVSFIASFENNLMDFFPTASKFFRKEIFDNVPDYYFIGDAGDFPGMVLTLSYGEAFYSGEVMAAYRIDVPGSSNNRFNQMDLNKKLNYFDERIQLLEKAKKELGKECLIPLEKSIAIEKNNKLSCYTNIAERFKQYLLVRKCSGYKYLTFQKKLKLFLNDFFPIYSTVVEIKNRIISNLRIKNNYEK